MQKPFRPFSETDSHARGFSALYEGWKLSVSLAALCSNQNTAMPAVTWEWSRPSGTAAVYARREAEDFPAGDPRLGALDVGIEQGTRGESR
jgi:hypothetical protein